MNIAADVFKMLSELQHEEIRNYIGASSIGRKCERAIYYDFHGAPSLDFNPKTKIAFEVGKKLETLILDFIEKAGYSITYPKTSNKMLGFCDIKNPVFQGHADALLTINNKQYILEIKTAKSSRYQTFVKHGLRKFSETYFAQLQAYMGMSGIHRSVLLAMNKDTHELHCQWVDFDKKYYVQLQDRALRISQAEEPPERISKSPFYDVCNRCNFIDTCFFNNSTKSKRNAEEKAVDDEGVYF